MYVEGAPAGASGSDLFDDAVVSGSQRPLKRCEHESIGEPSRAAADDPIAADGPRDPDARADLPARHTQCRGKHLDVESHAGVDGQCWCGSPMILDEPACSRNREVDTRLARHDPCDVGTAGEEAVWRAKHVESAHAVGDGPVDGDAFETSADLQEVLASRVRRRIADFDIGLTAIAVSDVRRPKISHARNRHAWSERIGGLECLTACGGLPSKLVVVCGVSVVFHEAVAATSRVVALPRALGSDRPPRLKAS